MTDLHALTLKNFEQDLDHLIIAAVAGKDSKAKQAETVLGWIDVHYNHIYQECFDRFAERGHLNVHPDRSVEHMGTWLKSMGFEQVVDQPINSTASFVNTEAIDPELKVASNGFTSLNRETSRYELKTQRGTYSFYGVAPDADIANLWHLAYQLKVQL